MVDSAPHAIKRRDQQSEALKMKLSLNSIYNLVIR